MYTIIMNDDYILSCDCHHSCDNRVHGVSTAAAQYTRSHCPGDMETYVRPPVTPKKMRDRKCMTENAWRKVHDRKCMTKIPIEIAENSCDCHILW